MLLCSCFVLYLYNIGIDFAWEMICISIIMRSRYSWKWLAMYTGHSREFFLCKARSIFAAGFLTLILGASVLFFSFRFCYGLKKNKLHINIVVWCPWIKKHDHCYSEKCNTSFGVVLLPFISTFSSFSFIGLGVCWGEVGERLFLYLNIPLFDGTILLILPACVLSVLIRQTFWIKSAMK